MSTTLEELAAKITAGRAKLVPGLVQKAMDEGVDPLVILNSMVGVMDEIGERFQRNEVFVPEMLIAAKAMKKGMEVLRPVLTDTGSAGCGKVVIGTVAGDLHDIGKNLVAMMIESAGFEVIDLGVDVPAERFAEICREDPEVHLVALSSLLTTTMPAMKETVALLNAQDFRSRIKIMVGGAPISAAFAEEIGADAYTEDAASAAAKAKELVA